MKIKLICLFFLSLCFLNFTSCNDDDVVDSSDLIFLQYSSEINSIIVESFSDATIGLRNVDSQLTVKSNDESVATVSLTGDSVMSVRSLKVGKTTITVTDSKNRLSTLSIEVVEMVELIIIDKHSIEVVAENLTTEQHSIIENIKKDIEDRLLPEGSGFELFYKSKIDGTLAYYPVATDKTSKINGTFRLETREDDNRLFIRLNFNDKEYLYLVKKDQDIDNVYYIPNYSYWIADFTEEYSQMANPKISMITGSVSARNIRVAICL